MVRHLPVILEYQETISKTWFSQVLPKKNQSRSARSVSIGEEDGETHDRGLIIGLTFVRRIRTPQLGLVMRGLRENMNMKISLCVCVCVRPFGGNASHDLCLLPGDRCG